MITLREIGRGFRINFENLNIDYQFTRTTITFKVLPFFAQLGEMLGYCSIYERNRYDLGWYHRMNEDYPFLHIEHENSEKLPIILETIDKILQSPSKMSLGIAYPWAREFMTYHEYFTRTTSMDNDPRDMPDEIGFIAIGADYVIYGESKRKILPFMELYWIKQHNKCVSVIWEGVYRRELGYIYIRKPKNPNKLLKALNLPSIRFET